MYVNYNANPSGKATGDCVIRAISTITGLPWRTVHWELAMLSNDVYQMMDDNPVWHEYLRRLGFNIRTINWPCSRVKDFCKCFPYGRYILGTGKHVIAVIDGDYYDTWDSGNELAVFYWKLEE